MQSNHLFPPRTGCHYVYWLSYIFPPLMTGFGKGLPTRYNFLVSSNTAFWCSRALLKFHADTEYSAPLLYKGRRDSGDEKMLQLKCKSWKEAGSAKMQGGSSQVLPTYKNWDVQETERPMESGQCFHTFLLIQPRNQKLHFPSQTSI